MSDVNVLITAVDSAIDILDRFLIELSDIHAYGTFELESICELVRRKCVENQNMIDEQEYRFRSEDYQEDLDMEGLDLLSLYNKQSGYEVLKSETINLCDEKKHDWLAEYKKAIAIIDSGRRVMLEYILKLNDIGSSNEYASLKTSGNAAEYYVIIVDSKKYPQTADHIRWAIKKGMPEFVTLGRGEAAKRRKESLRNVRVSPIYDRDEWPMACFVEGGNGSDVFYLDRSDNRGSGSSIRHQMSRIPNGSIIRIRIL